MEECSLKIVPLNETDSLEVAEKHAKVCQGSYAGCCLQKTVNGNCVVPFKGHDCITHLKEEINNLLLVFKVDPTQWIQFMEDFGIFADS